MKTIYIFVLTFTVSVIASAEYSDTFAQMEKIDRFSYDGPVFLKEHTLEKIRNLGALENETKKEVENKYIEGEKIPYYTFLFKNGLEIRCRYITQHVSGPHVQLIYVKITSKKWPVLNNLGVGVEVSQLKNYLGNPNKVDSSMNSYQGETQEVRFTHKNGIITKIEFLYYSG